MKIHEFTVFVAEDEELQLNSLVKKIDGADMGFRVIGTAQTGNDAMTKIDTLHPDVVFTDIRMPVMDGLELLHHIHIHHPYTKVVITSGFSDYEYMRKAIQYQACEYMLKPMTAQDIRETLHTLSTALATTARPSQDESFPFPSGSSQGEMLDALQSYIKNHYESNDIDLNALSEQMGYNPSYLSRIYKQRFGHSPSKYLLSLQIQKAENLLIHHPELSVQQVGMEVGYSDQVYFSRLFKKQTGMSPSEYRNTH
jgi:YesN/AraC family two-component response regulator